MCRVAAHGCHVQEHGGSEDWQLASLAWRMRLLGELPACCVTSAERAGLSLSLRLFPFWFSSLAKSRCPGAEEWRARPLRASASAICGARRGWTSHCWAGGLVSREDLENCCGALVWFLRFSSEREFFPQLNVLLVDAPTPHSALLCRKSLPSMFCGICLSVEFRRFLQGKWSHPTNGKAGTASSNKSCWLRIATWKISF